MPDIDAMLVAELDVKITRLEKSMARATQLTAGGFDKIERRSKQASQNLEAGMARIGNAANGMAGRVAIAVTSMLSLGAAVAGAKQALETLGDINDKSTAAGLDPELFQTVATAAKSVGVEVNATAQALATYAKNAGLAAIGQGDLFAKLQKLDPELLASIQHATTQEERLKLAADAINATTDSARRAALASALFGDAGVKIAAAFEGGGRAIDDLAQKLKGAGEIYDSELVQRSDDMGDKLDLLTQKIDVQLKTALVNLAPEILAVTGGIGDWIQDLNIVLDQLKSIEDRTVINPLENHLVELENRMAGLRQQIGDAQKFQAGEPGFLQGLTQTGIDGMQKQLDDLYKEAEQYQERIAQLQGKPKDSATTAPAVNTSGSPSDRQAVSDSRPVAPTTFDFRTVLDHTDAITKSAHDTTLAIGSTSDAVTTLTKNWESAEDMAQSFTSTLLSDARSGKGAIETLSDAIGQLADQLLQMGSNAAIKALFNSLSGGLVGGGGTIASGAAIPLGGFFPGLSGPKLLASGGAVRGAGTSTSDSIPAMLSDGEHVIRASEARKHRALLEAINSGRVGRFADGGAVGKLAGVTTGHTTIGASPVTINAPVTVHAQGGTPEQNQDLAAAIARELENKMRGTIADEMRNQMRNGGMLNQRSYP